MNSCENVSSSSVRQYRFSIDVERLFSFLFITLLIDKCFNEDETMLKSVIFFHRWIVPFGDWDRGEENFKTKNSFRHRWRQEESKSHQLKIFILNYTSLFVVERPPLISLVIEQSTWEKREGYVMNICFMITIEIKIDLKQQIVERSFSSLELIRFSRITWNMSPHLFKVFN